MKQLALSILLLAIGIGASPAEASGMLDQGFGEGGVQTMHIKTSMPWLEIGNEDGAAFDVLVDHEGRTVVAGEVLDAAPDGSFAEYRRGLIARYLKNGELDPSFNGGKPVTHEAGERGFRYSNLAELPDGRLLVAGMTFDKIPLYQSNFPVVCRFLEQGDIDTTFGDAGCRTVAIVAQRPGIRTILGMEGGNGLRVLPDGKIVLMGTVREPDPDKPRSFAVVRLNADGSDDMSFGGFDCPVPYPRCGIAFSPDEIKDLVTPRVIALDSMGRIVVAGKAVFLGDDLIYAVRFDYEGGATKAFDLLVMADFAGPETGISLNAMEMLSDDSAVLVGYVSGSKDRAAFAAKFSSAGTLDQQFEDQGRVFWKDVLGYGTAVAKALSVQSDGKLLVGGTEADELTGDWFRAWRLDPQTGVHDKHFGVNGTALLAPYAPGMDYFAHGIAAGRREGVIVGWVFVGAASATRPVLMQFELDRLFSDEFDD